MQDTPHGRKHHSGDKRSHIQRHGGDELTATSGAKQPVHHDSDEHDKKRVGVDRQHKTESMRKHHRGTFP